MRDEYGAGEAARPVPWTVWDILFSLLLVYGAWVGVVYQSLQAVGFYRWFYGPDLVARVTAHAGPQSPPPPEDVRLAQYRMTLWAGVAAFPFQVASVLLVCYSLSRTRPAQLGLTTHRFRRNLTLGLASSLVVVPAVLGINLLVTRLFQRFDMAPPQEHPFTQLSQQRLLPVEWCLLVVSAVIAAPIVEELIFRGLLQPWFGEYRWGGHLAMGLALLLALASRREQLLAGPPLWGWHLLGDFAPAVFIVALLPFYLLVWWRSRTPAGPAVFGTAALFGALHSFVWPTPVSLFVFGLALGYMAHRTGSLVGPILMHALLNAVTVTYLLWR